MHEYTECYFSVICEQGIAEEPISCRLITSSTDIHTGEIETHECEIDPKEHRLVKRAIQFVHQYAQRGTAVSKPEKNTIN